jgi:hypothetical protein
MRAFRQWNDGKSYDSSVKPFNFVLLASEFRGLFSESERTRERAEWTLADIGENLGHYGRFGRPVKVNYKMIQHYLNGIDSRNQDQVKAIALTAAEHVAPHLGIDPERIGYGHDLIDPYKVLLQWRDYRQAND